MKNGNIDALTFKVGLSTYALSADCVQGVSFPLDVEQVPMSKPFVEGLCNLRGQLIPVIDASKVLNQKASKTTNYRHLILSYAKRVIILKVDLLGELIKPEEFKVEKDPSVVKSSHEVHVIDSVIHRENDDLVYVINHEKFFKILA